MESNRIKKEIIRLGMGDVLGEDKVLNADNFMRALIQCGSQLTLWSYSTPDYEFSDRDLIPNCKSRVRFGGKITYRLVERTIIPPIETEEEEPNTDYDKWLSNYELEQQRVKDDGTIVIATKEILVAFAGDANTLTMRGVVALYCSYLNNLRESDKATASENDIRLFSTEMIGDTLAIDYFTDEKKAAILEMEKRALQKIDTMQSILNIEKTIHIK